MDSLLNSFPGDCVQESLSDRFLVVLRNEIPSVLLAKQPPGSFLWTESAKDAVSADDRLDALAGTAVSLFGAVIVLVVVEMAGIGDPKFEAVAADEGSAVVAFLVLVEFDLSILITHW